MRVQKQGVRQMDKLEENFRAIYSGGIWKIYIRRGNSYVFDGAIQAPAKISAKKLWQKYQDDLAQLPEYAEIFENYR